MLSRRGLITGLISLAAAPAIVRASSLMPVKVMEREADIYALVAQRIRETEQVMRDNLVRQLYGDSARGVRYVFSGAHEPIAFNRFFARVEFPDGR